MAETWAWCLRRGEAADDGKEGRREEGKRRLELLPAGGGRRDAARRSFGVLAPCCARCIGRAALRGGVSLRSAMTTAGLRSARAATLRPEDGERLLIVGDRVRILADGDSTGGQCAIFEAVTAPGVGPPLHRHALEDE